MRATRSRIVFPFLAASILFGIGPAHADVPPPDADEARQTERYVIQPGGESLFGEMLGRGESLPGNCTLSDGKIERTLVLATYTCGDAQVVLELRHPDDAAPSALRTKRFALATNSGTPPAGLVEAVAEKIRARESGFEWTEVNRRDTFVVAWAPLAAGALAVILVLWALRRRAAKRARSS